MDTKTLNLNFGDGEVDKIREVLRRMGEFIAYFEVAENKMAEWKHEIEETLAQHRKQLDDELQEIRDTSEELRNIMDETGAARLRIELKQVLSQGSEHVRALERIGEQQSKAIAANNEIFSKLAKKSFDRLDRATSYTIKNISEAIGSFRINDFQRLTDQTCNKVEKASSSAISRLGDLVKWFHWKNLGLAAAITLVTSITIGLYLNDEMPWETHKQVAMERNAGQALIKAWPNLSQTEQQRIIDNSKSTVI